MENENFDLYTVKGESENELRRRSLDLMEKLDDIGVEYLEPKIYYGESDFLLDFPVLHSPRYRYYQSIIQDEMFPDKYSLIGKIWWPNEARMNSMTYRNNLEYSLPGMTKLVEHKFITDTPPAEYFEFREKSDWDGRWNFKIWISRSGDSAIEICVRNVNKPTNPFLSIQEYIEGAKTDRYIKQVTLLPLTLICYGFFPDYNKELWDLILKK